MSTVDLEKEYHKALAEVQRLKERVTSARKLINTIAQGYVCSACSCTCHNEASNWLKTNSITSKTELNGDKNE